MFDIESRFDALPINQVLLGDAIEVLKTLPDNSVDALITDPPAGISFMGKAFDHDRGGMIPWVNWLSEILSESLRVMKPGAIGLVWSIPRTCGWTQLALELAGFRVIDSIAILNGSGFPKGLDISKTLEKDNHPDAVKWDGWKSAQLKPSHEDWFIVQKPVEGTIARNVLKWGVGGVNVEACRIGATKRVPGCISKSQGTGNAWGSSLGNGKTINDDGQNPNVGRYPANTILVCSPECDRETHARSCPVSILGEQGGERKSGGGIKSKAGAVAENGKTGGRRVSNFDNKGIGGDTGTAARYFKQLPHDPETFETFRYHTKASQRDRSCDGAVENIHPCVKNRSLMRYFCKLITPPGGIVLDPFGGSGSTAIGAIEEGFNYLLIEKEEEYHAIALARIAAIQKPSNQLSLNVES